MNEKQYQEYKALKDETTILENFISVETYPDIREYFGNVADYKKFSHWMPLSEPPQMKGGESDA